MKVFITGASSFTGFWFVQELISRGHEVTALFRRPREEYEGVRKERVDKIWPLCDRVVASFGDDKFIEEIKRGSWDVFCHHAAEVTDYKSEDFDIGAAVQRNTLHAKKVLEIFQAPLLYTGSIFEGGEGFSIGEELLPFSPYGLSKGLTAQVFKFWTKKLNLPMGKFVIPNPFGPYEEARYTSYLMEQWSQGKTPIVRTPDYVRDNIHVSLLAAAYADSVERLVQDKDFFSIGPSGYPESQGKFTARFAAEISTRLNMDCPFVLAEQKEFTEPRMRVNTSPTDALLGPRWDEQRAWDELAHYYQSKYVTLCKI